MIVVMCKGSVIPLLSDQPLEKDECTVEEVAWHLANLNRYTGGAGGYSVAQHCCLVSQLGSGSQFAKLIHDAHESIIGDVATPVKAALDHLGNGAWAKIEIMAAKRIRRKYGMPVHLPKEVHECDLLARQIEVASLFTPEVQRRFRTQGLDPIYGHKHQIEDIWDADKAFRTYMDFHIRLSGGLI